MVAPVQTPGSPLPTERSRPADIGVGFSPAMAFTPDERLHLAFLPGGEGGGGLMYRSSDTSASDWNAPVALATGACSQPGLATAGNEVVVLFARDGVMLRHASPDGGRSWRAQPEPVRIDGGSIDGAPIWSGQMTATPAGRLLTVVRHGDALFLAASSDQGRSWRTQAFPAAGNDVALTCVTESAWVALAWSAGDAELQQLHTHDGGQTWLPDGGLGPSTAGHGLPHLSILRGSGEPVLMMSAASAAPTQSLIVRYARAAQALGKASLSPLWSPPRLVEPALAVDGGQRPAVALTADEEALVVASAAASEPELLSRRWNAIAHAPAAAGPFETLQSGQVIVGTAPAGPAPRPISVYGAAPRIRLTDTSTAKTAYGAVEVWAGSKFRGYFGMLNDHVELNAEAGQVLFSTRSVTRWCVGGASGEAGRADAAAGDLYPHADGRYALGRPEARIREVWTLTGAVSAAGDDPSSQGARDFTSAEQRAARRLRPRLFRHRGAGRAWHAGVTAQDVVEAFAAEGLDAHDYGVLAEDRTGGAQRVVGIRHAELSVWLLAALLPEERPRDVGRLGVQPAA